ncbi:elongation factor P-like protein EfpL [Hydrogenovibrio kuenenii]|uniref:elongation factor P-like protein EfpL n=1 Tax=Hydrogenovibrio kuenenii TaxID=63658 RepID=UPI000467D797|nr:elongation factor P-like protein YeiP [Hydrogenovibrio kuenenii]
MPKISELKKGSVVEIDGAPHIVKTYDVRNPSSRGASTMYKVRFYNLRTGQKVDETFKGEDMLKEVDTAKVSVMFSYIDGDSYVFMNNEDFSQYLLDGDVLEEEKRYLTEGLTGITALLYEDQILSIELPTNVDLEVTETNPGSKASGAGRTKPAVLSTGYEIQVPEFIEPNEKVKVSTLTGKFISRA